MWYMSDAYNSGVLLGRLMLDRYELLKKAIPIADILGLTGKNRIEFFLGVYGGFWQSKGSFGMLLKGES